MMKKINEISNNSIELAENLRLNAEQHKRFQLYLSMEQALSLLISGNLYLSDGQGWNDVDDRAQMKSRGVYGKCFSCTTTENIAFWMLYGGKAGKTGAMLSFPRTVIRNILNSNEIFVGKFEDKEKATYKEFVSTRSIQKGVDYEIYMTDVLYKENVTLKNDFTGAEEIIKYRLTYLEQHRTVDKIIIDSDDIFVKNYAWSNENESRLIVRPLKKELYPGNGNVIRITLSKNDRKIMQDNLYISPLYDGKADVGKISTFYGKVEWDIK